MLTLFYFVGTVGGVLIEAGSLTRCRAAMANTSVGRQAAGSEQLVRELAGGWGGSRVRRVEMLTDHGKCCFGWLLGYQPLTDGICDDVLDVIEDIAGETVIELTQEENNMQERYDLDKKSICKKESERCDTLGY